MSREAVISQEYNLVIYILREVIIMNKLGVLEGLLFAVGDEDFP